ncbi:MAG: hypothetical protein ACJARZ_000721 [Dokdonia sp.]|jgi:hypothetical protein
MFNNKKIFKKYKFESFLITLVFILFGSLIFNESFFLTYLFPIGLLLNIATGIYLISNKKLKLFITTLFLFVAILSGFTFLEKESDTLNLLRFAFYFIFYIVLTFEIIHQIWHITEISRNLFIGVISGYLSLGLVGFFIFLAVEIVTPGTFQSELFVDLISVEEKFDSLLYYSFITLMTIGYGEIIPVTSIGQKATMLLGLLGQFYVVIITAVVVGKYLSYKRD